MVGNELTSGCCYANGGVPSSSPGISNEVVEFVKNALRIYSPASCFVIDVAEVIDGKNRNLKVVEYNSINSAGFYACDKLLIVKALSNFVLEADLHAL